MAGAEILWAAGLAIAALFLWYFYMMTFRTKDFIALYEADKERIRQSHERRRWAHERKQARRKAAASGVGLALRMLMPRGK